MTVQASECKCCMCGRQAYAFWPCIDPDIPQQPYCKKCLREQQLKLVISVCGEEEGKRLYRSALRKKNKEDKDNETGEH